MKFWDTSAIVPLVVDEVPSERIRLLADRDPEMFVWWATEVECSSALARHERAGTLDAAAAQFARENLKRFADRWDEIEPSEVIRETAKHLLRFHPLRTADSLQVAAAFVASQRNPASLEFVTLDGRLADAARKEGFPVVDIPAA